MRLEIKGLAELRAHLAQIRPEEIMAQALEAQAERMAEAVRDGLSNPPGGDHDKPWARTGALRDSIQSTASGLEAAIGSNDPAAAPQEMGTLHAPPRPFLSPIAAVMGEEVAQAIATQMANALRGELIEFPSVTFKQFGTEAQSAANYRQLTHSLYKQANGPLVPDGTGITPSTGTNPLDPRSLATPPSASEQTAIADTLNSLYLDLNSGSLAAHPYRNDPNDVTGAQLPTSSEGYVTMYIRGSNQPAGDRRLLSDPGSGRIFYTQDHYESFIEVFIKGSSR